MCRKDRIPGNVLHALFSGHATNCDIRVHPAQPQGGNAFGFALTDNLDNYNERKQYDEAGKENGDVRNYLARHFFRDVGKDAQRRKKGPLPSEDRLAKARDLAPAWQQSEIGRNYQAGKCPPSNVVFNGEEEICELQSFVGVMRQHQYKAGGIIKHYTNTVKKLAATQAFPGVNVDEGGSSSEPPAKKAKQLAKPAAGVPA
eukprot:jgi/Tetstr1/439846/TSEL_028257.t1